MKRLFLLFFIAMTTTMVSGQKVINLWPNGAPNDNGDPKDRAELYVYLPDAKKATGRCVVVCPGGAYSHLALDHEGKDWAYFFNHQGIALVVLKYRMPNGRREVPVNDALEAMRTVRTNARNWSIDPNDVGIMGFSAGGHLASVIATRATGEARANFQILFYPVITMDPGYTHQETMKNFLGHKARKKEIREFSSDRSVSGRTPRAFIALSDDDSAVLPENGVNFYQACYRHDVPATLHIYPSGGHGWGYRESFPFHMEMLLELKAWLASF